ASGRCARCRRTGRTRSGGRGSPRGRSPRRPAWGPLSRRRNHRWRFQENYSIYDTTHSPVDSEALMHIGIMMFSTDQTVAPAPLARMIAERGFEAMFLPEHSHI